APWPTRIHVESPAANDGTGRRDLDHAAWRSQRGGVRSSGPGRASSWVNQLDQTPPQKTSLHRTPANDSACGLLQWAPAHPPPAPLEAMGPTPARPSVPEPVASEGTPWWNPLARVGPTQPEAIWLLALPASV